MASIHPRVQFKNRVKLNTAKPAKRSKYLRKMQKKLGNRRLAHAATLKSLPGSANPAAYRTPGSMRLDKR